MTNVKPIQLNDFAAYDNPIYADDSLNNISQKPIDFHDKDETDNTSNNKVFRKIQGVQKDLKEKYEKNRLIIHRIIKFILLCGYFVYFGFAMRHEFGSEPSIRLLWITCTVVFFLICNLIYDNFGTAIYENVLKGPHSFIKKHFKFFKWSFIFLAAAGFIAYIIGAIAIKHTKNLVSLSGYVVYITMFFAFSHNPSKVKWRPVIWGLGLQFVFALLILRTSFGFSAFEWLGQRISEFLSYSDEGAKFVFGDKFTDHPFAFKVLPVIIFFSTVVSTLYYLGVMQVVILKIAYVIQKPMGTSAAESVNAAGNIFIGQTEAPLLIRPLLPTMSDSEIHAVMVGGFASIAGAVMATYILFGVPANHLITASVMAAPCSLAMSKLSYPEVDKTEEEILEPPKMEKPDQQNVIEAAASGASTSIKVVANIAANLIAFIALLGFINATLKWFGSRVGLEPPKYPELTFQLILSYLLWPLAFVMGVDRDDCRQVAQLIGFKTFINEFVAYTRLGKIIDNSKFFNTYNGTWNYIGADKTDIFLPELNRTLIGGVMDDRSIIISTYALCGFANVSSIGMVIGALGALAPEKKSAIARMAVRAMITGCAASFMNACTSGLLYQPK